MDSIEKLIQSYAGGKPDVKAKALELILQRADRRLTPILVDAFEEVGGQKSIVRAMVRIADPDLIQPMIDFLEHPDPWRRVGACDVLGALGHPDATLPLTRRLEDPHLWTRVAAVRALAHIQDPRSAGPLLDCYQRSRGEDVNMVWALEGALDALGVEYEQHVFTDEDP